MIDFNKNAWFSGSVTSADRDMAKEFEEKILADLRSEKDRRFELGVHLIELFDSRAYVVISRGQGHAQYFWQFCEERLNMGKSQVSRYMNVVAEFGDGHKGLHKKWRDFSWSVLVELLPLAPEAREFFTPDMTCDKVRKIKRGFVARPQRETKSDEGATFTASDKQKIDAMKEIYGDMSTDELMLELYRLREELMRYQEQAEGGKKEVPENTDECIVEV